MKIISAFIASTLFFVSMPSLAFVGNCETILQETHKACDVKWRQKGEGGWKSHKQEKFSGTNDTSKYGKRYLDRSAEESNKIAQCLQKVRKQYCKKDECGEGTACHRVMRREQRLRRSAKVQGEHAERMEQVRRQTREQIQQEMARAQRQQENLKSLDDMLKSRQQEQENLASISDNLNQSPEETTPTNDCKANGSCPKKLNAEEKQNENDVSQSSVAEDENNSSSSDEEEPSLSDRIEALKAEILNPTENMQRTLASIPMMGAAFDNSGAHSIANQANEENGSTDEKALSTGETLGYINGGSAKDKNGKPKRQDGEDLEEDKDFKLDPNDKNPNDDKKINIANFLPKNDPRLSFADFVESQPYEPPLTSASGPSLFEKLNWRYESIKPLMEK